jgi:hypothetical protein
MLLRSRHSLRGLEYDVSMGELLLRWRYGRILGLRG